METVAGDLKMVGERAFNLLKVLNVKEGFGRADDSFPKIWLSPKVTPDGSAYLTDYYHQKKLVPGDLETLLDDYYQERGWDPLSGRPTEETLKRLNLKDI